MTKPMRYQSLSDYVKGTGTRRVRLARDLGVSRFQMAGLLYPDLYPVVLTDDLTAKLAALLNQPVSYVRKLYTEAA